MENIEKLQCGDCEHWSNGTYCSNCGQKLELSQSLGAFILQALPTLLSDDYRFDSRFVRTLLMLFFNPGKLTRRYHEGKRTRYLSPITMLFTAVFLLFTLPILAGLLPEDNAEKQKVETELHTSLSKFDAKIELKLREIGAAKDEHREELIEEFETEFHLRNLYARLLDVPLIRNDRFAALFREIEDPDTNWFEERVASIVAEWEKNPKLKSQNLRATLIKFGWFLIPLTMPMMVLFMPGRRENEFKHALFAGYSLAFIFMLLAISYVLEIAGANPVYLAAGAVIIGMIHLFIQTKNSYRLGWLAVFTTYFGLLVSMLVGLILFVATLFLLHLI